jgi:hypothetical protein
VGDLIEQPPISNQVMPTLARKYQAGSERSRLKLVQLGYDPIQALVNISEQIEADIKREYDIRDGRIVTFNAKGQEKNWYPETLLRLIDMRINVAAQLLRYGYGRVEETVRIDDKRTPQALIVNTTKKGEVYVAQADAYSSDGD